MQRFSSTGRVLQHYPARTATQSSFFLSLYCNQYLNNSLEGSRVTISDTHAAHWRMTKYTFFVGVRMGIRHFRRSCLGGTAATIICTGTGINPKHTAKCRWNFARRGMLRTTLVNSTRASRRPFSFYARSRTPLLIQSVVLLRAVVGAYSTPPPPPPFNHPRGRPQTIMKNEKRCFRLPCESRLKSETWDCLQSTTI